MSGYAATQEIIFNRLFQYAHGFALITDGPIGVAKVGTSYLALIVPAGPRNPNGETPSK
jgi:hypothetical protein